MRAFAFIIVIMSIIIINLTRVLLEYSGIDYYREMAANHFPFELWNI